MGSLFSRLCNTLYNTIGYKCNPNIDCNNTCVDNRSTITVSNNNIDINNRTVVSFGDHIFRQSVVTHRETAMDVTKNNFVEVLQQLDSVVRECDFITIDTELSGLRRLDTKVLHLFDTVEDRYGKLKSSISGFNLIQFGLTCFKRLANEAHIEDSAVSVSASASAGTHTNAATNDCKYECNSYNFYVFPQKSSTINKSMGDRVFSVQSSSLQFLVTNGFDFNKLIIDGISYLNDSEEKLCLEAINAQKQAKISTIVSDETAVPVTSAVTVEDKKFVDEILAKVRAFIADENQLSIDLSPCNGFKRKLIYELIKCQDFSDCIDIKTERVSKNSIDRYISISKVDKEIKERKDWESLTEAVGFTNVVKLMIKYQKPVVGHNVLLDLMHTFNQFIEPLANDYKSFKHSIHALFPIIYDTKQIASSLAFKDMFENTVLADLYERLNKYPFKRPEVDLKNGKYSDDKCMHEAGYDSYITGLCFIGLVQYLGSLVKPKINGFDRILMSDFQNKLHLMYSLDIHYLNLEAEDIIPNRDHVFHITFPKEWKTNELFHLFSAFGGVAIGWLSDTSAFCALKDVSNTEKIKKSLVKQSSNAYKVISYNDFVNKIQKQNNVSPNEGIRDSVKRNPKSRASPQSTNPHKKPKVFESKKSDNKSKVSKLKQNPKLFEEPFEWDVEHNVEHNVQQN